LFLDEIMKLMLGHASAPHQHRTFTGHLLSIEHHLRYFLCLFYLAMKLRYGATIMIFVYASLIVIGTCSNALAYTDPGSGLLIWQMLCAALVGVIFQYNKIITFIKLKFKKHD
jgi:hypothetical protein